MLKYSIYDGKSKMFINLTLDIFKPLYRFG